MITGTSLTVCLLYIHLIHGRQTFKFALKNKLHELHIPYYRKLTLVLIKVLEINAI